MKTSLSGLNLIKDFEGFRTESYLCPSGVWTIGYGHTKDVEPGMCIDETEATDFLMSDVKVAERVLNSLPIKFKQSQFDALVSFIYNVGSGNFLKSTLLKVIKEDPEDPQIKIEFLRWTIGGGKTLPGLIARRSAEMKLYFK